MDSDSHKQDQRTELILQLKIELKKCLLLSDEDKKFWLENAEKLPQIVVEGVLKVVKEKNDLMETYLHLALEKDADHTHLAELKEKIKKLKQGAMAIEEKTENPNADALLQQKLANL